MNYPRIFQLPSFGDSKSREKQVDLIIGTYNIREFKMDYGGSSLEDIQDLAETRKADILCLQEVPSGIKSEELTAAFPSTPHIATTQNAGANNISILSRYPILSVKQISFPERPNCAIIADIAIHGRRVKILNCHLQTTNWNQLKNGSRHSGEKIFKIIEESYQTQEIITKNVLYRAHQADSLSEVIRQAKDSPIFVCGDFNDIPLSYTYKQMRQNLSDSFCEQGEGFGYTYRYLHRIFRIDYLFFSPKAFEARFYDSPKVPYSDHNPVFAGFRFK